VVLPTVAAGENKSSGATTGANLRRLEEETEDFHGRSRKTVLQSPASRERNPSLS
jgi:hypothetical protein